MSCPAEGVHCSDLLAATLQHSGRFNINMYEKYQICPLAPLHANAQEVSLLATPGCKSTYTLAGASDEELAPVVHSAWGLGGPGGADAGEPGGAAEDGAAAPEGRAESEEPSAAPAATGNGSGAGAGGGSGAKSAAPPDPDNSDDETTQARARMLGCWLLRGQRTWCRHCILLMNLACALILLMIIYAIRVSRQGLPALCKRVLV